jgi:zinc transport system ATP-binding protein
MSVAVRYDQVTYSYGGGLPAVENVTLTIDEGVRLGVLGPNGGGKSTLLKLTLGLIEPSSGLIELFGMSPREARRERIIGYVPQRNEAELAFPLSVRQVIEMPSALSAKPWSRVAASTVSAIDDAMELVGVTDLAGKRVNALSGGQMQRVMIARAIASKPRLLLLDEPTVGIDVSGQQQFAEMLTKLHTALNLTVIVVSHEIRTVAAGCDRIACLSRTLHSHVSPEGLTPRVLAEVFRHDMAGIFGDLHVDAHEASNCTDPSHAGAPVPFSISAKRRES